MAELTKTDFEAKYAANAGGAAVFKDNTTGDIGADDMRSMGDDIKDSALFIQDNFVDEDDMASDADDKVPSQQSVKAYVDRTVGTGISVDISMRYREDFSANIFGPWSLVNLNSGAATLGSSFGVDNTEKASGVAQCSTVGASNNGAAIITTNTSALTFGFGFDYELSFRAALSALSDGTDTYTVRMGFLDSTTGAPTDGAYFRYTHGTNGGKWEAVTVSNGSETPEDTGVSADAGTFHVFKIIPNSTGTQVDFYIDGVKTNDITTNVINSSSRLTGHGAHIIKSVGTNARLLYLDYIDLIITRTTAR